MFCAWCCWLSAAFIPPWNQQSIKEVLQRAALIQRGISEASSCCFIPTPPPTATSTLPGQTRVSTSEGLSSPPTTAPLLHFFHRPPRQSFGYCWLVFWFPPLQEVSQPLLSEPQLLLTPWQYVLPPSPRPSKLVTK